MRGLLRHGFVFRAFRFVLKRFFQYKFHYDAETVKPDSCPYIVLSNHTTNYDALMVGVSFPTLLFYVASDHIFRWGLVSRLITYLVDPIARLKAKAEIQTVKQILTRLKKGDNVCIFAEGNRTFNGETGGIPESTGKLIKLSGVALITYRISGGYFSNPRWARTLRRGSMTGRKVREYSPEQIGKMTADELNETIRKDLYVNAYEDQKQNPVEYKGKNLAEHLEISLYLCPKCGGIGTLYSSDDRLSCSCGLDLSFSTTGFLQSNNGEPAPFQTILDWSRWQSREIIRQTETFKKLQPDKPIILDAGQKLFKIEKAKKSKLICEGTLKLYNNRMVMEGADGTQHDFPLGSIADMAIYSRMVLIFSTSDQISFEIKSDHPRSAIKYLELYKALKLT